MRNTRTKRKPQASSASLKIKSGTGSRKMRYRTIEIPFPIETLEAVLETYFRSISGINDDETPRIWEFGNWDRVKNIIPLKITVEKTTTKGGVTVTKF